ncbi:MAG: integrase [Puniceicoccaceae bacterium 5H]|nr:MAG: integrase [Puniceicoccaceae bacterium 5H]
MQMTELRDGRGRKYLTRRERQAFFRVALTLPAEDAGFCLVLLLTGCRISEALRLKPVHVDHSEGVLTFETLKRRRAGVFRSTPVPRSLLKLLPVRPVDQRLWAFSRPTAYRLIKGVMRQAGIKGTQACPKGLRHGFGVACVEASIPLTTISTWMGHANIRTTAIYLNVVGEEERRLARRLWSGFRLDTLT